MVYVTEQADKTFLSREACRALRLIPTSFPSIMETNQSSSNASDDEAASQEAQPEASSDGNTTPEGPLELECSCPRRELPPQVPLQMPYASTEANRKKLEEYLLQCYTASTFNTCEHQTLPMMQGPALHLMIDPQATPKAHHTPIPVPIDWREEVKAGLDRDVRLGVLEPVPIGQPVTWCHRMVVCAKKTASQGGLWICSLSTHMH